MEDNYRRNLIKDSPLAFMNSLAPVLITHYQQSGSVYLHSLFDGHEEVLTIPGVPNFNILFEKKLQDHKQALGLFNQANEKFYNTSNMDLSDPNSSGLYRLGENANEGILTDRFRFEVFFEECIRGNPVTPKNIILSIYYAYARTHGEDLNKKKIILYHPHITNWCLALHEVFPGAKCIIPIRDPIRSYISRIKFVKYKSIIRKVAYSHLGFLFEDACNVMPLIKNDMEIRIVRIEDFATHSKYVLSVLCRFMGIEYNASLECSTFGGKKFWGVNPEYKSDKFLAARHGSQAALKTNENVVFGLINKRLNLITGYKNYNPTKMQGRLAFILLFLPFEEDIRWFKEAFIRNAYKGLLDSAGKKFSRIKTLAGLVKERFELISIYYKNQRADVEYEKIAQSFIKYPS